MTPFARCYAAILSLAPPAFRERYARDATELAAARLADTRGAWRRAARAAREIADAIRTVRAERRAARAGRFPSPARSKGHVMDAILRDFRFAVRALGRAPGFSILAIATLAVGIGSTALMFTTIYDGFIS